MQTLPFADRASSVSQLAERRLQESPYFYLRALSCQFTDGVLTLRGRVPYEQLGQAAENIVARIDGVHEVINCVEVVDPQLSYLRSSGA